MKSTAHPQRHTPSRDQRSQMRGFGPLGLLAIFIVLLGAAVNPLVSASLILLWVVLSGTPWREIGFVRPKNWSATIALATMSGVLFKLALKSIVMPLLGAAPVNAAYHYLVRNPSAMAVMLFYILAGAGFAEELFFRGYLFERSRRLFGEGTTVKVATVLFTASLFGIAHLQGQGWDGVKQATVVGLVFGGFFAITGRLVPIMIAHASFDLTAIYLIYFDIEAKVAHVFFQ